MSSIWHSGGLLGNNDTEIATLFDELNGANTSDREGAFGARWPPAIASGLGSSSAAGQPALVRGLLDSWPGHGLQVSDALRPSEQQAPLAARDSFGAAARPGAGRAASAAYALGLDASPPGETGAPGSSCGRSATLGSDFNSCRLMGLLRLNSTTNASSAASAAALAAAQSGVHPAQSTPSAAVGGGATAQHRLLQPPTANPTSSPCKRLRSQLQPDPPLLATGTDMVSEPLPASQRTGGAGAAGGWGLGVLPPCNASVQQQHQQQHSQQQLPQQHSGMWSGGGGWGFLSADDAHMRGVAGAVGVSGGEARSSLLAPGSICSLAGGGEALGSSAAIDLDVLMMELDPTAAAPTASTGTASHLTNRLRDLGRNPHNNSSSSSTGANRLRAAATGSASVAAPMDTAQDPDAVVEALVVVAAAARGGNGAWAPAPTAAPASALGPGVSLEEAIQRRSQQLLAQRQQAVQLLMEQRMRERTGDTHWMQQQQEHQQQRSHSAVLAFGGVSACPSVAEQALRPASCIVPMTASAAGAARVGGGNDGSSGGGGSNGLPMAALQSLAALQAGVAAAAAAATGSNSGAAPHVHPQAFDAADTAKGLADAAATAAAGAAAPSGRDAGKGPAAHRASAAAASTRAKVEVKTEVVDVDVEAADAFPPRPATRKMEAARNAALAPEPAAAAAPALDAQHAGGSVGGGIGGCGGGGAASKSSSSSTGAGSAPPPAVTPALPVLQQQPHGGRSRYAAHQAAQLEDFQRTAPLPPPVWVTVVGGFTSGSGSAAGGSAAATVSPTATGKRQPPRRRRRAGDDSSEEEYGSGDERERGHSAGAVGDAGAGGDADGAAAAAGEDANLASAAAAAAVLGGRCVGQFHPAAYLEGGGCIELLLLLPSACGGTKGEATPAPGVMLTRSAFERAGGSVMAKWYRSIKVLPEGTSMGNWLKQNGLPIIKGLPRNNGCTGRRKNKQVAVTASVAAAAAEASKEDGGEANDMEE
ncbi:hypothetical protein HYH02_007041 [Chlamydomonas schloesseri]|uniref:Uncharacterized protein n=1 Tax=Chlamydomonas schloesseri TaxID=2026947 RepID=A0A836B5H8_9CHLO|nr:hypothetical protein HYH02_007041 [Chlamydomonas schloesseri]|eukprot:KAG2448013.1 hypothetical protein HYH02_007041 [Chlamydomonas schloesseri]